MTCQANGISYSSNPFTVYISWAGMCNNDKSGRTYMDISPEASPPNKQYLQL
jgi:hypothetical protein